MMREEPEAEYKAGQLEALLFAAARPLSTKALARRLEMTEGQTIELLERFTAELNRPCRGLQLRAIRGSWRLETKPEHSGMLETIRMERGERPLSQQALESLAVVALRQPVTTEEVTATRGLDSSATMETLRKRKMITRSRDREADRTYWRTTQHFLDVFGLTSLADLYRVDTMESIFGTDFAYGSQEQKSSPD